MNGAPTGLRGITVLNHRLACNKRGGTPAIAALLYKAGAVNYHQGAGCAALFDGIFYAYRHEMCCHAAY